MKKLVFHTHKRKSPLVERTRLLSMLLKIVSVEHKLL
jgi:hypothetical protein